MALIAKKKPVCNGTLSNGVMLKGNDGENVYVLKFNTGYLAKCRTLGAGNGLFFFNNERIFLESVPSLALATHWF